jgi:CAAX prenyl protease-like protein
MPRHPAIPWVAPFVVFLALLALRGFLPYSDRTDLVVRTVVLTAVIALVSRPVLDFRVRNWAGSLAAGVAVFALWVGPDLLFPGYRTHWLFQNFLTGSLRSSLGAEALADPLSLALRTFRAAVLVAIAEELFWRGWLLRWLVKPDFTAVPPGTYSAQAFWISAVLFASEHGPYWDVGLLAGIAYNWWMVRTKSLGDLIFTHGVTNACLSAFVITTGRWEYWM